jgi:hypothetical protein
MVVTATSDIATTRFLVEKCARRCLQSSKQLLRTPAKRLGSAGDANVTSEHLDGLLDIGEFEAPTAGLDALLDIGEFKTTTARLIISLRPPPETTVSCADDPIWRSIHRRLRAPREGSRAWRPGEATDRRCPSRRCSAPTVGWVY